jgi:hypothetical protein
MDHAKLIVHRGATRVTRAELVDFHTPPATDTWKPIPHAALVGAIHQELAHRHIGVMKEEYAVQRQTSMLFGVMTLNWLDSNEFAAALAFRHANDKSEAVKMYAGVRVFNCDNMSLSGDEIILNKKHSKHFSLPEALPEAFDRYKEGTLQLQRDIGELQHGPLNTEDAKKYIFDIFRRKIVPLRLFHPVVDAWHTATAGSDIGTYWTLHNCFTLHTKTLAPNVAMRSTVRLGKFFGLGKAVQHG